MLSGLENIWNSISHTLKNKGKEKRTEFTKKKGKENIWNSIKNR
jgi:hypothetical protein